MANTYVNFTTCEGRGKYLYLYHPQEPRAGSVNKTPKYGAELIVDKGQDLTGIKNACAKVLTGTFPDAARRPKIKLPIHEGDDINSKRIEDGNDPRPEIAGKWVLRFKNKKMPFVVDQGRKAIPEEQAERIRAGYFIRVGATAGWFDVDGNKGITFYLKGVQLVREAETFENTYNAEDAFTVLPGATPAAASSNDDPDSMFA